jgi:hypothetical protein
MAPRCKGMKPWRKIAAGISLGPGVAEVVDLLRGPFNGSGLRRLRSAGARAPPSSGGRGAQFTKCTRQLEWAPCAGSEGQRLR